MREISRSGLVEIAAHTDASHYGALANPQGNTEPAAAVRKYDARNGRYENEAGFEQRMGRDVAAISEKIRRATGKAPRVWVWPYGAEGGTTLRIAGEQGYQMALTLEDGPSRVARLMSTPRMLLANDPTIRHFANSVASIETVPAMRFAHVDLDYIYDPDPAQTDRNLGELVQRIVDMQINTVFLQAYADPQADGRCARSTSRTAGCRCGPTCSTASPAAAQPRRCVRLCLDAGAGAGPGPVDRPRGPLGSAAARGRARAGSRPVPPPVAVRSGRAPAHRRPVRRPARHAFFDGILFHDDAMLGDFEDAGPAALAAYQKAGLPGSIAAARRSRDDAALDPLQEPPPVDFTAELAERARAVRGPRIKTARNLYAEPLLNPASEAWFAQNPDDFLDAYDWTAPMAMPYMEKCRRAELAGWTASSTRWPGAGRTRWTGPCSSCRPSTGAPAPAGPSRRPSTPRRWPAGCSACSCAARAASAITPTISRKTSPGCKASGPPSPKRGSPSDDRPSSRPAHPVRGAERALRLRPGADQPALLGFVFFYPLFMSGLWMAGGLYYWWHWERHWAWGARREAPALAGNPLVSILVPCYNEADNGEDTLLAALNQNYPHIEVIAINDGSSDGTAQMLDRRPRNTSGCAWCTGAEPGQGHGAAHGRAGGPQRIPVCIDGDAMLDPDAAAYRWRR